MGDRDGLITRIRQMRRGGDAAVKPAESGGSAAEQDRIGALEARVSDLEHLVQGLQDSVHREAKRQGKRLSDLEARIEPAELTRMLSQDARQRGL